MNIDQAARLLCQVVDGREAEHIAVNPWGREAVRVASMVLHPSREPAPGRQLELAALTVLAHHSERI